jgi:hypothetical protein
MVHSFEIRDSICLRSLIGRGICFDSRTCLTQDLHPLRRAVLSPLLPELYPETVVLDHNGRMSGFAQLAHRRGDPSSQLRFLSPKEIVLDPRETGLIEAVLHVAGRRQAQHILADAEENTEECGFLRRGGFSIYARQDIWKAAAPFPQPTENPPGALRPLLSSDTAGVHALYCSIVPALVHQVEGFPRPLRGWKFFEEGELVGFFHLRSSMDRRLAGIAAVEPAGTGVRLCPFLSGLAGVDPAGFRFFDVQPPGRSRPPRGRPAPGDRERAASRGGETRDPSQHLQLTGRSKRI